MDSLLFKIQINKVDVKHKANELLIQNTSGVATAG